MTVMISETMALKYDIESANIDACKRALLCGADVNEVVSYHYNQTPLHWSCAANQYEITELLLDHGANIDALDHNKQTALHTACRYSGRIRMAKFFIERRANTTLLDAKNKTPLDYLDNYDIGYIRKYIAELERQREEERLYAMFVLEQQRNHYFPVADIGSIVTAYLR